MDAALRPVAMVAMSISIAVSILVLVDAALRLATTTSIGAINGFNPCFSGCRPATHHGWSRLTNRSDVSILVLVDAALRPLRHPGTLWR